MRSGSVGVDDLEQRYGIPDAVRFEAGPNGLTRVVVVTPQAEAQLYLHGAHLTHYQPRGDRPLLFLSEQSRLAADAPIRGGVPIVFPWFGPKAGDPSAPTHGFARVAEWSVESATQAADGSVELVCCLDSAMATHPSWTQAYSLRYRVAIGSLLELVLEVHNPSEKPFAFEEALHTYLSVGDARQLSVTGLADTTYIDKTDGARRKVQGPEPTHPRHGRDGSSLSGHASDLPGGRSGLGTAARGGEVGPRGDGGLEPLDRQGQGHAGFRRRRVARDALPRDRQPGRSRRDAPAGPAPHTPSRDPQ
jgi:hypothetical protein